LSISTVLTGQEKKKATSFTQHSTVYQAYYSAETRIYWPFVFFFVSAKYTQEVLRREG